jgi:hypothetical protein
MLGFFGDGVDGDAAFSKTLHTTHLEGALRYQSDRPATRRYTGGHLKPWKLRVPDRDTIAGKIEPDHEAVAVKIQHDGHLCACEHHGRQSTRSPVEAGSLEPLETNCENAAITAARSTR